MNNSCHNCKSKNIRFIYKTTDYISNEEFRIQRCANCDLIFPLEYPEDINKYYPKKYRSYIPIVKKIITIKSQLYVRSIIKRYSKNSNTIKNKVIEIGCGNGDMLKIFKNLGWDVYGSERSGVVDKNNELNISNKEVDEYPNEYFDLALLYNSFEHLYDPREILKKITTKVKKNGLIIISVPSHESFQCKFGKQDWVHLDAPRHLNIFSIKAFKHMMQSIVNTAVLEIVSHKSVSFDLEFYGWFQTILNKFYKENNLFLKYLQDMSGNKIKFYTSLLQLVILSVPCAILSGLSMISNKGAITEIILKKKSD